jgi:spermidine synthase
MRFTHTSLDETTIISEMLTFAPLCVHENVSECLVIGGKLQSSAAKLCKNIIEIDELKTGELQSAKFDVIISFNDNLNMQEVYRILKADGIFGSKLAMDAKNELKKLGDFYRILMPFFDMKLFFASNKYHPTADLVLDKSDFLDEAKYYNSEIHLASFALSNELRAALKGTIKN